MPRGRDVRRLGFGMGAAALAVLVCACRASAPARPAVPAMTAPPAGDSFEDLVAEMAQHDRDHRCPPDACEHVAGQLENTFAKDGNVYAAYDGALVRDRCGDPAAAERILEKAVGAAPRFLQGLAELAHLRAASNSPERLDQAIDAARALVKAEPDDRYQARRLADLLLRRARLTTGPAREQLLADARGVLGSLLAVEPGDARVLHQLALVLLEGAPAVPPDPLGVRRAHEIGGPQREMALRVCEMALKAAPDDPEMLNTAGVIHFQMGEQSEAVALFERAAGSEPPYAPALRNLGAAMLRIRDFVRAEAAADRLLAIEPNDYDGHLIHGVLISSWLERHFSAPEQCQAEAARGERELQACLAVKPQRPDAYVTLAGLLAKRLLCGELLPDPFSEPNETTKRALSLLEVFSDKVVQSGGGRRELDPGFRILDQLEDDYCHRLVHCTAGGPSREPVPCPPMVGCDAIHEASRRIRAKAPAREAAHAGAGGTRP